MATAYHRGFSTGLLVTDDPVTDKLGPPTAIISAIERFVDEEGPSWERGFWDGVAAQPEYLEKCRLTS